MKGSTLNGILTVEVPRPVETRPKPVEQEIVKDDKDDIEKPAPAGRTTVFISYRRIDSGDITGRIYDRLIQRFDRDSVFKDVDSIPLGVDFRKYLMDYVGLCDVLIAVIGKHWLTHNSASDGGSLGNSRDFVSIEIESALERHVPITPVLVQGATMPSEEELPDKLRSFAYYNAIPVRPDPDFNQDCARLIQGIEFHIYGKAKKR